MAKKQPKPTTEVILDSPYCDYLDDDRQIVITTRVWDEDKADYVQREDSLFSILTSYFENEEPSAAALQELERVLMFGLKEIARAQIKAEER